MDALARALGPSRKVNGVAARWADGHVDVYYLSPGTGQVRIIVWDPEDPGIARRYPCWFNGGKSSGWGTHVQRRRLLTITVDFAHKRKVKPKAWLVSVKAQEELGFEWGEYFTTIHERDSLEEAAEIVANVVSQALD